MKVRFHFDGTRVTVGGFLMALGTAVATDIANVLPPSVEAWLGGVGLIVVLAGILISISGLVRVRGACGRIYPVWQPQRLYRSLERADERATISMLQTSFPDGATIIPEIRTLLENTKRFKLRILMPNPGTDLGMGIIAARVRLRGEDARGHAEEIKAQIRHFIDMKTHVDQVWEKENDGAKLNMEIRLYDHLPFGPQFHVGDSASFVGTFLATKSSVWGPMLELQNGDEPLWDTYRQDFEAAWAASEVHALDSRVETITNTITGFPPDRAGPSGAE